MMATNVEELTYVVNVDNVGLDKGLKAAEDNVAGSSNRVQSLLSRSTGMISGALKAVGTAAVAGASAGIGALGALTKSAVDAYADYEQLTGGIETLFKSSSGTIMDYASQAYKTAGISANKYMEQATSFSASLLQGLGGDTNAAAQYANKAITDMADNANKMGTSIESIQYAYQGFAKGNYTMLDNLKLGYGGTASEMARLINDTGVMGDSFKATAENMNQVPFDKVIEGIHKVQERMGITGTTAKEASETVSGSISSMKASWENLMAGLGNPNADIGGLATELLNSFTTVLGNLTPVIQNIVGALPNLITTIATALSTILPNMITTILPALINGVVSIVNAIALALPTILPAVLPALIQGIISIATNLLTVLPQVILILITGLIQALPQLLAGLVQVIIAIANALTDPNNLQMIFNAGVTALLAIVNAIPDMIVALVDALPTIIENIINWLTDPNTITTLIDASVKLFMGIVKAVPKILGSLVNAFGSLFGNLWNRIVGIFSGLGGQIAGAIGGGLKAGINGVLGIIEGAINIPFDLINGAIGIINMIPGVNIGKIPRMHIPRLYTGGIVEPGGRIIQAGDGGEDEWVVPESKMASLIDKLGSAGGDNITINISGVFATSSSEQRKVAEQIFEQFEMIKRQRLEAR